MLRIDSTTVKNLSISDGDFADIVNAARSLARSWRTLHRCSSSRSVLLYEKWAGGLRVETASGSFLRAHSLREEWAKSAATTKWFNLVPLLLLPAPAMDCVPRRAAANARQISRSLMRWSKSPHSFLFHKAREGVLNQVSNTNDLARVLRVVTENIELVCSNNRRRKGKDKEVENERESERVERVRHVRHFPMRARHSFPCKEPIKVSDVTATALVQVSKAPQILVRYSSNF